ncbi:MAG: presenilin family intramembrane aspartyl protease [Candidatus Woesearchaeota archaeon]|nr:presenilin family intramembrane aspartyl protease [Candidatus Woesearchaeota archaeon]
MKHTISITLTIVLFFIAAQIFGLFLVGKDMNVGKAETGEITTFHNDTAVGARPEISGSASLVYILVSVIVGTIILLIFARFRKQTLWKVWYFFAVWMAISISIGVFTKPWIAIAIAAVLALAKLFIPNPITHNSTEFLIYAGITVLIVPIFNAWWALLLLIAFSLYDAYAVWKSAHMIKLAKFQMESKIFAGFFIPYSRKKESLEIRKTNSGKEQGKRLSERRTAKKDEENSNAILGGGDIALPMIFAGAVMEQLVRSGLSLKAAFFQASIISFFSAAALLILMLKSEKGKFYPAMPFITAGCILGAIIVLII